MIQEKNPAVLTETVEGRYGKIRFFANDPVVGQALRLYGEWAQVELEFFERLIPDGGAVLDIGGYVGTHALAFADFVGPHGKVYTFEPQPATFELLVENLAANDAKQVVARHAAVGKAPAVIELPALDVGSVSSFGSFSIHEAEGAKNGAGTFSVDVVTVDQLDLSRCDFMKIDVEGMESEVIDGAASVIARFQPVIYAECNSVDAGASTLRSLKALGYSAYLHVVEAYNPDNFKGAATNIFGICKEVGILALPPSRDHLAHRFSSPKWTTFDIETLDDLVYGMLQKPQYGDEVLRVGAAAKAGGKVVQEAELRSALGQAEEEKAALRGHAVAQAEAAKAAALAQAEAAKAAALAEAEAAKAAALAEAEAEKAAVLAELDRVMARQGELGLALSEADAGRAAMAVRVEQYGVELDAANARANQHYAAWLEEQTARIEEQTARERDRIAFRHERDALRAAEKMLQSQAGELARIEASPVYKALRKVIRAEGRRRAKSDERPETSKSVFGKLRKAEPSNGEARPPVMGAGRAFAPVADSKPLQVERIAGSSREPVEGGRPLLLCLSHVAPWPPRAGNEYRIHRVLKWAKQAGYDLALVLCPLPGEELTRDAETVLAGVYDNLLVIDRRGRIRHAVARNDLATAVEALANRKPARYASRNGLGEKLQDILKTFAPDALLEVLREIDRRNIASYYWVNYGFMSRAFDAIESDALTLIDTHDVFSTKAAKVSRFGVRDDLCITAEEEGLLLDRADIVVAIQSDEARELEEIVPAKRIVTVGVDVERSGAVSAPVTAPVLLMVASNNAMNQKGLVDFLRFAWPRIRQAVPKAELHVVGAVGQNLTGAEPGVSKLGFVENLEEAYDRARLVINPAVAGTGLKIKTLEALAQLKPVVLWPSGLDGVSPELHKYCSCVQNWYEFGEAVIALLRDKSAVRRAYEDREVIAQLLSPDHVYRDLKLVLDEHKA